MQAITFPLDVQIASTNYTLCNYAIIGASLFRCFYPNLAKCDNKALWPCPTLSSLHSRLLDWVVTVVNLQPLCRIFCWGGYWLCFWPRGAMVRVWVEVVCQKWRSNATDYNKRNLGKGPTPNCASLVLHLYLKKSKMKQASTKRNYVKNIATNNCNS